MEELFTNTASKLSQLPLRIRAVQESPLGETQSEKEANTLLEEIRSQLENLETLVGKEPSSTRPRARLRLDQLRYDSNHLISSLRSLILKRRERERQDREREQLLASHYSTNGLVNRGVNSTLVDAELDQSNRISRVDRALDDQLSLTTSVLGALREQRERLRTAGSRLLGTGTTLGMSHSVLGLIERRTREDRWLLYGCIVISFILMFLVWLYLA